MKVWWVLAWAHYYPSSGLGNVHSTYETEEEATRVAEELKKDAGDFEEISVVNISHMIEARGSNEE